MSVCGRMWSTHMLEYRSAMKTSEALILATTWVDFEIIMLSKRSQIPKTT